MRLQIASLLLKKQVSVCISLPPYLCVHVFGCDGCHAYYMLYACECDLIQYCTYYCLEPAQWQTKYFHSLRVYYSLKLVGMIITIIIASPI